MNRTLFGTMAFRPLVVDALSIGVGLVVILGPSGLALALFGDSGLAGLLGVLVSIVVSGVLYWFVVVRLIERRRRARELDHTYAVPLVGGGLVLATVGLAVIVGVLALCQTVTVASEIAFGPAFVTALSVGLSAGVLEELFFRGVLFRVIERRLGSWWALAVSAAVFGMLHALNPGATVWSGIAIVASSGVCLAAVFILTRSIWFGIGMHVAWDFLLAFTGMPESGRQFSGRWIVELNGPTILTGGDFGIESSVVTVAFWLLVSTIAILFAVRLKRVQPRPRKPRGELSPKAPSINHADVS